MVEERSWVGLSLCLLPWEPQSNPVCAWTHAVCGGPPLGHVEGAPAASLRVSFSSPVKGELGSETRFFCAHNVFFYQVTASGVKNNRLGLVAHSWTKAIFVTGLLAKVIIIFLKIDPDGGEQPRATKAVVGVLRNSSSADPSAPKPDGYSIPDMDTQGLSAVDARPCFLKKQ